MRCRLPPADASAEARKWIARAFAGIEDVVYVGLGLLLAGGAIILLVTAMIAFGGHMMAGTLSDNVINLLDRILLILLIVELLYTVQVSFREHAVLPEPFLLIGLIAAIRRVLVITAEFGEAAKNQPMLQYYVMELAVLTGLILALSLSLLALRRRAASNGAAGG